MDTIPNGVVADPRPIEAIAKDYIHIGGSVTPNWIEKTVFKRYTQRNQDGSYSCGMQAGAKAEEALTGKVVSSSPYFWRKNYPGEGMFMQDIGDILYNRYTCLESNSPSQNQNETQMNTLKPLTTTIGITGYRTITNPKDIEQIAEAIEAYGQCIILLESNTEEYQVTPFYNGKVVEFGHYICGVDYGLVNGVKTIVAEDSAGQFSSATGVRYLTADWIVKRVEGALYFLGGKDTSVPQDTKYIFNNDMHFGQVSSDIIKLQERLISMGYSIPAGATGYFGGQTRDAVLKYQIDHIKLSWYERYILSGSTVGLKTRQALNSS